jgi:hypothetical protein
MLERHGAQTGTDVFAKRITFWRIADGMALLLDPLDKSVDD